MRIISGKHKGRKLPNPVGQGVRPTSDRVREALFSTLEGFMDLDDTRVLDLYAGSGSLGLEALSRGASSSVFVEANKKQADTIKGFLSDLGETSAAVHVAKVEKYLKQKNDDSSFDLILADPPYEEHPGSGLFEALFEFDRVASGAWLAVESRSNLVLSEIYSEEKSSFQLEKTKTYGDTKLWYYCYKSSTSAAEVYFDESS